MNKFNENNYKKYCDLNKFDENCELNEFNLNMNDK